MKALYLYIPNKDVNKCIKYGIKLSEYSNKIIKLNNAQKKGIIAFLSPKDSNFFNNEKEFTCLKINTRGLNVIVYNNLIFNTDIDKDFICDINKYSTGDYEEPLALICSSILPEHINIYNKIIDSPLIVDNSKEFYYKKSVFNMLENDMFTSFEIYQLLLILGQKKGVFKVHELNHKLKLYIDEKTKSKYTKKSNF